MSPPNGAKALDKNWLLAALPPTVYNELQVNLETIKLELKHSLYEPNQPIEYVYFPRNGVMSILMIADDGGAVEVATVGNEGMIGIPVLLGATTTPGRAITQVPGEAARMRSETFRAEIDQKESFRHLLQRYTQALFVQMAQSAACNRLHPVEERCARWLLMTHDRVEKDEFPLTQEFLSQMLGVRRATVNIAARMLQQAGFIEYNRGIIRITDREGLESASCECYQIIRTEFDQLFNSIE